MSELIDYTSAVLIEVPEAIKTDGGPVDSRFSTQLWVSETGDSRFHQTRSYQPVPTDKAAWLENEARRIASGTGNTVEMIPVGGKFLIRKDILAKAKVDINLKGEITITIPVANGICTAYLN